MKLLLSRLLPFLLPLLKYAAFAGGIWLGAEWVAGKFAEMGRDQAVAEQALAAVGSLQEEVALLKEQREALSTVLEARSTKHEELRTSFDVLRARTRAGEDACTGVPLPGDYRDDLKRGVDSVNQASE